MSELLTPATSRRGFFKRAGLGAVAASAALQACDSGDPVTPPDNSNTVTLDFSTDTGVLNYAYALEQLEAAFFAQVVANPAFGSQFSEGERTVIREIGVHENIHRDFFRAALGDARIPDLTPDFSLINFGSRASVLTTAITFEDLGVGAYNGAGQILRDAANLAVAGKIVSVEARHASAIRDIILNGVRGGGTIGEGATTPFPTPLTDVINENALDRAMTPQAVLLNADPYIVQNIRVAGL